MIERRGGDGAMAASDASLPPSEGCLDSWMTRRRTGQALFRRDYSASRLHPRPGFRSPVAAPRMHGLENPSQRPPHWPLVTAPRHDRFPLSAPDPALSSPCRPVVVFRCRPPLLTLPSAVSAASPCQIRPIVCPQSLVDLGPPPSSCLHEDTCPSVTERQRSRRLLRCAKSILPPYCCFLSRRPLPLV